MADAVGAMSDMGRLQRVFVERGRVALYEVSLGSGGRPLFGALKVLILPLISCELEFR